MALDRAARISGHQPAKGELGKPPVSGSVVLRPPTAGALIHIALIRVKL